MMVGIPASVDLGKASLVLSGSVVLPDKEWLKLDIADLKLELHFISTDDKKLTVEGDIADKTSVIRFHNFDNPLGTSWVNEVGFVNGRHFGRVHRIGRIANQ